MRAPLIVGIGGTPRPTSTTECALVTALAGAKADGARTALFGGAYLARLPLYLTPESESAGWEMIEAVRKADGLIIASPGYHGTVSGMVKNALDYLEATAGDPRPYLDGLPVGLIATAFGWQATGGVLTTLRSIIHALRGWPTPYGAAINAKTVTFADGSCTDLEVNAQLCRVGRQVTEHAGLRLRDPAHARLERESLRLNLLLAEGEHGVAG